MARYDAVVFDLDGLHFRDLRVSGPGLFALPRGRAPGGQARGAAYTDERRENWSLTVCGTPPTPASKPP